MATCFFSSALHPCGRVFVFVFRLANASLPVRPQRAFLAGRLMWLFLARLLDLHRARRSRISLMARAQS